MMKSDTEKSRDELIEELIVLRQHAAKADDLQNRLADLEKSYQSLRINYEKRTNELEEQCSPLIDPVLGLLSALVLLSVPCPASESGPDPSCSPGQIPHLRRD